MKKKDEKRGSKVVSRAALHCLPGTAKDELLPASLSHQYLAQLLIPS